MHRPLSSNSAARRCTHPGIDNDVLIQATCASCGDVNAHDVVARICRTDSTASFRFRCSQCQTLELKATTMRSLKILLAVGVELEKWDMPLSDAPDRAAVITDREVEAFATLLADDATISHHVVQLHDTSPNRWRTLRRRFVLGFQRQAA